MKRKLIALGLTLTCSQSFASPWITSDETQLKHSIDLLVSHGVIKRPVNQYPLMWRGLVQDIVMIDATQLSSDTQFALAHVKHALSQAKQTHRSSIKLHLDDKHSLQDGFGERKAAQSGVQTYGQMTGKNVSAKVQVNYTDGAIDGKYINHYGSYVAVLFDNWSVSAEQLSYWWGPSNQNALLLSNNAAPMKALRVSRANSNYEGPEFLSFIGPWQFTALAAKQKPFNTLKTDGDFWGLRLSSMPINGLEIAFSSTGSDYVYTRDTITEVQTQQRLTSVDFKYSDVISSYPFAVYGELAGVNKNGVLPQDTQYTLGAESFLSNEQYRAKGYIEYSDTQLNCEGETLPYQCHFAQAEQGADYRSREQWIGAAIGPQSKNLTLAVDYYRISGYGAYAKLKQSSFDAYKVDRTLLEVGYQQGLYSGLAKASLSIWQDKPEQSDSETASAVTVSWEVQF